MGTRVDQLLSRARESAEFRALLCAEPRRVLRGQGLDRGEVQRVLAAAEALERELRAETRELVETPGR